MTELIQVATTGHVGTVQICRAEKRNALTFEMSGRLREGVRSLDNDPEVWCIVLKGEQGAFCAGTDLQALSERPTNERGLLGERRDEAAFEDFGWLTDTKTPIVAVIDGPAVGLGTELALQCDVRLMTPEAYLLWNFVQRGLVPDTGAGTWLLPRLVGVGRAMEILLSARPVYGREAEQLGLAQICVERSELQSTVDAFTARVCSAAPGAVQLTKQLVFEGLANEPAHHRFRTMVALEECFASEDHQEGVRAFLERREPRFRGS